jgi:hypothetical protein
MIPSPRRPRIRRSTILIVVAVAALAFPLGVLANHQFTDVPTGASYHDEVEDLVGAGITAGCGGTNYCPTNAVTRGSMAQFLVRGLGSVAQSSSELVDSIIDTDMITDVATVTLDVPGVSGTQYVRVQGSVVVFGSSASCPCNFGMAVAETAEAFGPNRQFEQITITGDAQRTFATSWVFAATPGTHTYFFNISTDSTSAFSVDFVNLTATTVPFNSAEAAVLGDLEPAAPDGADPNKP